MRLKINRNGPRFKMVNDWQNKKRHRVFSDGAVNFTAILFYLALIAVFVFILLFYSEPVFHSIRSSLAFRIIIRLVFAGIVLWLAWFVNPLPPLLPRSLLTLTGLLPFGELILPTDRIVVFFHVVLFFFFAIYALLTFLAHEIHFTSILAAIYLGIRLYSPAISRFTVTDDSITIFSLIVGIILAVISVIIYVLHSDRHERYFILGTICLMVIAFVFAFELTEAAVVNANFAFDFSDPQYYDVPIDSKSMKHYTRGPTFYRFVVQVEGEELWLNVSAAQFNLHEKGNTVTIIRHDGAFGVPYYMLDE